MTQQQHPITPPPELVHRWYKDAPWAGNTTYVADKAAQWGADQANADIERKLQEAADQELEACIKVIADHKWFANPVHRIVELRAARRPEPKSEKQQALDAFDRIEYAPNEAEDFAIIRRAIEQLPDEQ